MDRTLYDALTLEPNEHTVEIFYFFDPFSEECLQMEPIINKLLIEYKGHIKIKKILAPSLRVLTKCQAQSTNDMDNIALAYKAAEIQGRNKARAFMRYILNRISPNKSICTDAFMREAAELAGLDVQSFFQDAGSKQVKALLKRDLAVYREMDVEALPSMVFFSGDVYEEGVKVAGVYPYHIYTYIINELLDIQLLKNPLPAIHEYIETYELVSFYELKTVFEWRTGLLLNELNKLCLKNMIQKVDTENGDYYKIRSAAPSLRGV